MKNKFSEQLSLALDRHKESTQQQVADGTHISPGQLSRLKNGSRNTDPQIRKSLANKINDFWLKYSGARENLECFHSKMIIGYKAICFQP